MANERVAGPSKRKSRKGLKAGACSDPARGCQKSLKRKADTASSEVASVGASIAVCAAAASGAKVKPLYMADGHKEKKPRG